MAKICCFCLAESQKRRQKTRPPPYIYIYIYIFYIRDDWALLAVPCCVILLCYRPWRRPRPLLPRRRHGHQCFPRATQEKPECWCSSYNSLPWVALPWLSLHAASLHGSSSTATGGFQCEAQAQRMDLSVQKEQLGVQDQLPRMRSRSTSTARTGAFEGAQPLPSRDRAP